jgi:hypothetical protein
VAEQTEAGDVGRRRDAAAVALSVVIDLMAVAAA